jgi:hypothetical protein
MLCLVVHRQAEGVVKSVGKQLVVGEAQVTYAPTAGNRRHSLGNRIIEAEAPTRAADHGD